MTNGPKLLKKSVIKSDNEEYLSGLRPSREVFVFLFQKCRRETAN